VDAAELGKIPLFTGLTLDQCESVAGVCSELELETGSTLLQEGDFGFAMFAITRGTADVIKDGRVVRSLGPGDVFGEVAVLSGGRRTATVVATSPIQLVTILNRDVWRMEREHPEIATALRSQIAGEVGAARTTSR
jgi:cAMP-dependent protein kinase regulator/CRP/FNR family cyclic AMP-dependent transcriptional regulator/cGMP-dependent protein kinase 2